MLSRREFLKQTACFLGSFGLSLLPSSASSLSLKQGFIRTKVSPYFKRLEGKTIMCTLCPRFCVVPEGKRGYCEVRENRGGVYYSLVYGNPCAVHIDPIEKKPFFHVLPASMAFSIATAGCNFDCKFCQNWEISQARPEETINFDLPPEVVVSLAKKYHCAAITSTYVEPTIFYEYMYDIGKLALKENILNTCHSNGYINPAPLKALCRYLDAACIDLKGFSEKFYREETEGSLAPVLETLKILRQEGVHIEIVNLVIPTKNDDMKMIKEMAIWIKENLGEEIPLHFSRFFPCYKLKNLPPTPIETLEQAREVALKAGLKYVYLGNVPGHPAENTYCPHCQRLIIKRLGYQIQAMHIKEGHCAYCGTPIYGIWSNKKNKLC
jgi:pyruvate formate lyase activating enzyme